ncbi:hypothetical protein ABE438_14160 [Bosea sp. TWI1241]|uniref:hypothetical protein n=1 Tax=Bosea sp. TWI1241 TaxID=3148904 RepID=UPI0032087203
MIASSSARRALFVLPALAVLLAGCGSSSSSSTGEPSGLQKFGNIVAFQSTTPPPANQLPEDEDVYFTCPSVIIADGGAAIRAQSGPDSSSLRHQVSITNVARECTNVDRNGGFTLKVGVEGRVLIGPAGGRGNYGATLVTHGRGNYGATLVTQVLRNQQVIARRSARVGSTVPAGQTGADFAHVEEHIVVPPGSGDVEVVVGLNIGGGEPARRRRR